MKNIIEKITNLFLKKQPTENKITRRKFKMEIDVRSSSLLFPEEEFIKKCILKNNSDFITYNDYFTNDIIVECENKPTDLPVWGIWFIELNAA